MKVALAARLRSETTMRVGWIAERLAMGTPGYLNHLVYRRRKLGGDNTISRTDPFVTLLLFLDGKPILSDCMARGISRRLSLTSRSGILRLMASTITTVTTKMQVTIPEEVRRIFPVQAGSRLSWSVEGETLVARRVRGVSELRGCLTSDVAFPGIEGEKAAVAASRSSHYATKHRRG